MADSASEYLYRTDLNRSHELAFDLLCYGSMKLPAFEGTLSSVTAIIIRKLAAFAPSARRVLSVEIPDNDLRQKLLTKGARYKIEPQIHQVKDVPVVWALNGIIHSHKLWVNHVFDREPEAYEPKGAILIHGFGYETDTRSERHVDIYGLALGFLSRSKEHMEAFLNNKGRQ